MSAKRPPRTDRPKADPFAGKGLTALQIARECVSMGACKRTIALMTGLPPSFILRFVFDRDAGARRGRPRYSDEFLGRASLRLQAGASSFAARYERLRVGGFPPAQSLITAFKHYLTFPGAPELLFDEAFYLCCNLDGIWAMSHKTLQLTDCRGCGSRHLQAFGSIPTLKCAFCNCRRGDEPAPTGEPAALERGRRPSGSLEERLAAFNVRRALKELGASDRTVDALMSGMAEVPASLRPAPPTQLVNYGLPLPLARWSTYLKTVRRIQFSLLVSQYYELRQAGFEPEESLVAAFRHLESKFCNDKPVTLDRCLEVVSLVDARWGVQQPELDRHRCPKCCAEFLLSRKETARQPCPFCSLLRYPSQYRGPDITPKGVTAASVKADFRLDQPA